MSTLEVWIIIILIVGVIASNLAVLKYSAKFKLPQFGQHDKNAHSDNSQAPADQQNITGMHTSDAEPKSTAPKSTTDDKSTGEPKR